MTDARTHLAYLIWCYTEGYLTPEDRETSGPNWLEAWNADADQHPDDVENRNALLGMADEILALLS
jgi:hypothetical protein